MFIIDHVELNHFYMINVNQDNDNDVFEELSTVRLSCFAQTVQLWVRDGLKNSSYMSKIPDKCKLHRALQKFFHTALLETVI